MPCPNEVGGREKLCVSELVRCKRVDQEEHELEKSGKEREITTEDEDEGEEEEKEATPRPLIQLFFFVRENLFIAIIYRHRLLSVATNLYLVTFRIARFLAQESWRC